MFFSNATFYTNLEKSISYTTITLKKFSFLIISIVYVEVNHINICYITIEETKCKLKMKKWIYANETKTKFNNFFLTDQIADDIPLFSF